MGKHVWTVLVAVALVSLLLLYTVAFVVDYKQLAIVKTFGKAGPALTAPGLYWKWPWPVQSLQRYDARSFLFDDTHSELTTADRQNILVTVYCQWRIDRPEVFMTRVPGGQVEAAEKSLRDIVRNAKTNVIGARTLSELVNTDRVAIADIQDRIRDEAAAKAEDTYGVKIVALGIKNFGLGETGSKAVIESMKKRAERDVQDYASRGDAVAAAIESRAQLAADQILGFANAKAASIRTEGDREAAKYYAVFARNEPLAIFLRELEVLQQTLKTNTVFVLDKTRTDIGHAVGMFQDGPSLMAPATTTAPSR